MLQLSESDSQRFWKYVDKQESGCWLWTGCIGHGGYGKFSLVRGTRKTIDVHRLSYYIHKGEPKNYVCHTCDIPACVNPDHLYDGTPTQNIQDAIKRGRSSLTFTGEANGRAKLKQEDVDQMRKLYSNKQINGLTQEKLGSLFGVSIAQVCRILSNKRW